MIELLLLVSLTPMLQTQPVADVSIFGPFPPLTIMTAKVRPCVWPNRCGGGSGSMTAKVRPCVWPNRCGGGEPRIPVLADIRTCELPNRCSGDTTL